MSGESTRSAVDHLREEVLRQRLAGGRTPRRPVPPRADRSAPLLLSYGQERMWLLHRMEPDSLEYLVPLVFRLRGTLDVAALRKAADQVVARHEILRTRYQLAGTHAVQVIDPVAPAPFAVTDLTDRAVCSGREPDKVCRDLVSQELRTPFDLATEHPLRLRLYRHAADDHVLTIVFHHIACDDWSIGLFWRDLRECYRAARDGEEPTLAALPIQYADYAASQRDRLTGDRLERQLAYWQEQLRDLRPLELPTDRSRPAVRDWTGGRHLFTVPGSLVARLRELARQHDTTLFVVLVSAYQTLLSRYTGQRDIGVGTAIGGRYRPEQQALIGFLLNTAVLRARWTNETTFSELLHRNRITVLDAIDHQETPLQQLVSLDRTRDLSRSALFQVMFDLLEEPPQSFDLPGVEVEQVEQTGMIAKYDLTLQHAELPDGSLFGAVEYASALFDPATAERFAGHYLRLLDSIVTSPDTLLSDMGVIGHAEYRRLTGGPAAASEQPACHSVSDAVAATARQAPDSVAMTAPDIRLSYGELHARANQIAHHLRELGVGSESVVGVCLSHGESLLPALLGVWRAGAAYVPIDPVSPPDRASYMLADSGAAVLLSEAEHAQVAAAHRGPQVLLDEDSDLIDMQSAADLGTKLDPDALAYVIYTSGSTGRPKGVLATHGGLANYLGWAARTYAPEPRHGAPTFSSVAFDLVVTSLFVPLVTGQAVHLMPSVGAGTLGAALAAEGPFDFIKLTPAHLELLVQQLTPQEAAGLCRFLVVGGEAFPAHLLAQWRDLAGAATAVVNEYGPTEVTVANAIHMAHAVPTAPVLPIGAAAPGTAAYVLDDGLRPAPIGVIGELYVGGTQVARGYQGSPGLTAERYLPDPYGPPGGRLYRTGDHARVLPTGDLEFVGRADEQVKIAGYRIEPGELVAALTALSSVREAVVTAPLDAAGRRRLVAHVVPTCDAEWQPEHVREQLRRTLPDYLLPSALVAVPHIPLTANGKVDREALPAFDREAIRPGASPVALDTPLQVQVAQVWNEVLGTADVGAEDNFFDFGGDSLRAVALVGTLRETGLDVTVQDVFEHPTVEGICQVIAGRTSPVAAHLGVHAFELIDPAVADQLPPGVQDAYPLAMVQAGMIYEMFADSAANNYHNTTTFTISDGAPFSPEALRAAAAYVVSRHEALRTSIDLTTYSQPLQLVHEHAELSVGYVDVRQLPPPEQDRLIDRCMAEERARLFDLRCPSLLRAVVHDCAEDRWALTISECHAVLEGWSYNVMLMELLDAYRAIRDGGDPAAEELPPMRYADFIAAEAAALRSDPDRDFWRRVIDEHPPVALPPTWAAGPEEDPRPYKLEVQFGDLIDRLGVIAEAAEVPLKSVLHSMHLKVMGMLTDQPRFSSGLVCDARPEVRGADRVLGMYLNTVPFAHDRSGATWKDLARAVFDKEIALWPHRRFPVPAMQRELAAGRRLNEVMFNYLDFRMLDLDRIDGRGTLDDSPNEFSLSVTVFRLGTIDLTIHPRLIGRAHGARLACLYRQVLEAMVADPDGDARQEFLPRGEHERVVETWNDTAAAFGPALLPDLVASQASANPDAGAVIDHNGRVLTYAELEARANQVAWYLRSHGVEPETFVGICVEHSFDMVIGLLGIMKAGGAYVPLDPDSPAERMARALADTGTRIVVTDKGSRSTLPTGEFDVVCLDADRATIGRYPMSAPPSAIGPDNLVYAMFTSGSTGRPKGVMITHGGLANYLRWAAEYYACGAQSDGLMLGSAAFDLSITNLFVPLVSGRSLALLSRHRDIDDLAAALTAKGSFGLLKLTPTHLDMLRGVLAGESVDTVATYVVGGENLRTETAAVWRRMTSGARIVNEYGPTETVVGCAAYEMTDEPPDTESVPIGRPIANMRIYVLDSRLQPVPIGVQGELYVGGVGVARGYVGRPGLTADRFAPDPFGHAGERLYRTGDIGRWRPNGQLEFLGRTDDQVKIRGYRVELHEVEAAVSRQPGVAECVVVLREDRQGERRLVAYVVRTGEPGRDQEADGLGMNFGTAELAAGVRRTLPAYMVPAAFVVLPALPVGANGKVERRLLPVPANDRPDGLRDYAAPATETESVLGAIWAEVLGLDRVGVRDDFFELGGDSILTLAVAEASRRAGLPVAPRDVLAERSVAALAAVVDARVAAGQESTPAVPATVPATGPVPLTPIQRWFVDRDTRAGDYTQSVHLRVEGRADPVLLEHALRELVHHHDALRLRLAAGSSGPVQWLAATETARLCVVVDVSRVDAREQAARQVQAAEEVAAGLDPETGPMVQVLLFEFGQGRPDEIVVLAHRLVVDNVSWQVIVADLASVYRQLAAGRPVELPRRTTPFSSWARRLEEHADSPACLAELEYWQSRPAIPPLPVDRIGGVNTARSAMTVSTVLPAGPTEALLHRLPRGGGPRPHESLLAAVAVAVADWSGHDDVLVDLESHGRESLFDDTDLSRSVGWFTTLSPLAVSLPEDRAPECVLASVTEQLRSLPRNGIGFGVLRYLSTDGAARRLAGLGIPEICVNYLGRRMDYVSPHEAGAERLTPTDGPAPVRFVPVLDSTEPAASSQGTRSHLLEVNASEYGGRLEIAWTYSSEVHAHATVHRLADAVLAHLTALA